MTDLIPFTFQELMNNESGVSPDPYFHWETLVLISPNDEGSLVENFLVFPLEIVGLLASSTFYLENNFVWASFTSVFCDLEDCAFFGGIVKNLI